jgi:hypothetical protein
MRKINYYGHRDHDFVAMEYTADWAAAGMVVEWMEKRPRFAKFGLSTVCESWKENVPDWWAVFSLFEEAEGAAYRDYGAEAKTAPLAISLAFLRAMGVEVGE